MRRLGVLFLIALVCPVPGALAWTWPVDGPVLRPFAFDPAHPYAAGQHRGVDLGAATAAAVAAPVGGVVSFAGTVPGGGETVSIEARDGHTATLQHLGTITVKRGESIAEGSAVGTVGPSGTAELSQPFVYLGIRLTRRDQSYVDPLSLLPTRSGLAPETPTAPAPAVRAAAASAAPAAAPQPAAPPSATPAAVPSEPVPAQRTGTGSSGTEVVTEQAPAWSDERARAPQAAAERPDVAAISPARDGRASQRTELRPVVGRDVAAERVPWRTHVSPTAIRVTSPHAWRMNETSRGPVVTSRRMERVASPSSFMRGQTILFASVVLGLTLFACFACAMRGSRTQSRARIMSLPESKERVGAARREAEDFGRTGVALRGRQAASGPRRRLRGAGRHLRALPPVEGQRRADDQWHRRARHAGDGHGRSGGRLAA